MGDTHRGTGGQGLTAVEKAREPTPRSKLPRPICCNVSSVAESQMCTMGCSGCGDSAGRGSRGVPSHGGGDIYPHPILSLSPSCPCRRPVFLPSYSHPVPISVSVPSPSSSHPHLCPIPILIPSPSSSHPRLRPIPILFLSPCLSHPHPRSIPVSVPTSSLSHPCPRPVPIPIPIPFPNPFPSHPTPLPFRPCRRRPPALWRHGGGRGARPGCGGKQGVRGGLWNGDRGHPPPTQGSPAHAVAVAQVVALAAVRDVQEDDDASDEVHQLARGQHVQVGAAVPAPIPVAGLR